MRRAVAPSCYNAAHELDTPASAHEKTQQSCQESDRSGAIVLRLTVLGSSPSMTNAGGAGSGYLVSSATTRLLLDCGPGVVGRLRAQVSVADLDAVAISHFHPDHYIDLVSLRYGLRYANWRSGPLPVYVPPGGIMHLSRVGEALSDDARFFSSVMQLVEYDPWEDFSVGDVLVRTVPVRHYLPSHALAVASGERRMTYSADAAPCDSLVEAACGSHLLLCEATLASGTEDAQDPNQRGHMSGLEAGEVARQAGVSQLLLTHLPTEGGPQRLEAARTSFAGQIGLAEEGRSYDV